MEADLELKRMQHELWIDGITYKKQECFFLLDTQLFWCGMKFSFSTDLLIANCGTTDTKTSMLQYTTAMLLLASHVSLGIKLLHSALLLWTIFLCTTCFSCACGHHT